MYKKKSFRKMPEAIRYLKTRNIGFSRVVYIASTGGLIELVYRLG